MYKLLLFSLFTINSFVAFAAEETSESGGLPQFDINSYPKQIFWLFFIFICLYFILSSFILPKIKKIKISRDELINSNIINYKKNLKDIEDTKSLITSKLNNANLEAKNYIASITKDLYKIEEEKLKNIKQKYEQKKIDLNESLKTINNNFINSLDNNLINIITEIFSTLNLNIDQKTIKTKVEDYIKTLKEEQNV